MATSQRVGQLHRDAIVALYSLGRLMHLAEFFTVDSAAIRGAADQFQAALAEWLETRENT